MDLAIKLYLRLPEFIRPFAIRSFYLLKYRFEIGYFKIIQIETYSDCNRDCWFCFRKMDRSGIRKDKEGNHVKVMMPAGKVLDIIDQAHNLGYTGEVCFNLLNEPTLDERIFGFAKYAKLKGMSPSLTTNGDILRKKNDNEYFEKVIQCFDKIHIGQYDFSNYDNRSEDRIRLLEKLYKAKFVDFWGGTRQATRGMDEEKFEKKYEISVSDFIKSAREKPCMAPSIGLNIRYDGKILACCVGDAFAAGDINKQSIEEYWFSKEHIHLARTLKRAGGRKQFDICNMCPDNGDFPEHIQARICKEEKEKKDYYYATPLYNPNNLNPDFIENNSD